MKKHFMGVIFLLSTISLIVLGLNEERKLGFGDHVKIIATGCIGMVVSQFFESDLYTVELNWCPSLGNTGIQKVILKRNEVEKSEGKHE